jgi:hypothetical protein
MTDFIRTDAMMVAPVTPAALARETHTFRDMLSRLWWHTEDDYLKSLITACATALGDQADALSAESACSAASEGALAAPVTLEPCFDMQENALDLAACVARNGERLLRLYDAALEAGAASGLGETLSDQRAELADMVALLKTLEVWLSREARLVDARLDDLIHGKHQPEVAMRRISVRRTSLSAVFGVSL